MHAVLKAVPRELACAKAQRIGIIHYEFLNMIGAVMSNSTGPAH